MSHRHVSVFAGVACALTIFSTLFPNSRLGAQESAQESAQEPTRPIPLALSVSGGISLGSYQAGFAWALTHVVRNSREQSFRELHSLPELRYSSIAGASAGNINGVFAAVESCQGVNRRAESSLFWSLWIPTGLPQLMPDVRYGDPSTKATGKALLSRSFTRDSILPRLQSALKDTSLRYSEGCGMPVGITLTRLDTLYLAIGGAVRARAQRVAGIVSFEVHDSVGRFVQPSDAIVGSELLGETLFLVNGAGRVIDASSLLSLVEASSAFPVAFEPVKLDGFSRLEAPECLETLSQGCLSRGTYSDGGVFDNNPVDLALWLHLLGATRDTTEVDTKARSASFGKAATTLRLVYIDPDLTRLPYSESSRQEGRLPADFTGLSAVGHLMSGAIPAARQYELATVDRTLERNPGLIQRRNIHSSSRSRPIIGDRLGAFAGFLGRPFREHDFFIGVYDAMRYVAAFSCTRESGQALNAATNACVDKRILPLQSDLWRYLPPSGRWIVQAAHSAEMGRPEPVRDTTGSTARDSLVWAVYVAAGEAHRRFEPTRCDGVVGLASLICGNGFAEFLSVFGSRPEVQSSLKTAKDNGFRCDSPFGENPQLGCVADEQFAELVRSPMSFTTALASRALRQADRVERQLRESGKRGLVRGTSYGEIALHSTLVPDHRRGPNLGPSSRPFIDDRKWLMVPLVVPYALTLDRVLQSAYVTNTLRLLGGDGTLGLSGGLSFGLSWGFMATSLAGRQESRPLAAPSVGYYRRTGSVFVPSWEASVGTTLGRHLPQQFASFRVGLLAGKAHAGLNYYLPVAQDPLRRSGPSLTVGFADLNGLSYWVLRRTVESCKRREVRYCAGGLAGIVGGVAFGSIKLAHELRD